MELVEVHDAAPASLAEIVLRTSGIHHVATFVESIDAEQAGSTEIGWGPVMTAETASGMRYAFHDARDRSSATCSRCTSRLPAVLGLYAHGGRRRRRLAWRGSGAGLVTRSDREVERYGTFSSHRLNKRPSIDWAARPLSVGTGIEMTKDRPSTTG